MSERVKIISLIINKRPNPTRPKKAGTFNQWPEANQLPLTVFHNYEDRAVRAIDSLPPSL
jgi:hypothetical protein